MPPAYANLLQVQADFRGSGESPRLKY